MIQMAQKFQLKDTDFTIWFLKSKIQLYASNSKHIVYTKSQTDLTKKLYQGNTNFLKPGVAMFICELVNFREKNVSGNKDGKVVNSSGRHGNLNIYTPNNRTQKRIRKN